MACFPSGRQQRESPTKNVEPFQAEKPAIDGQIDTIAAALCRQEDQCWNRRYVKVTEQRRPSPSRS